MAKWKKIDSAPLDGTRVLLACPKEVGSGHYWNNANRKNPRERWVWDGYPRYKPTHWMPLPEPSK